MKEIEIKDISLVDKETLPEGDMTGFIEVVECKELRVKKPKHKSEIEESK